MTRTRNALLTVVAIAAVLCTQPVSAALSITGTIPSGRTPVVIIPANPRGVPPGVLKLKFSSPSNGATLSFCLGPVANPCGTTSSLVVDVSPGQEKLAVIDAQEFFHGAVLVVGQGTNVAVGYSVSIE